MASSSSSLISKQTHVSTALATHLLSSNLDSNVVFSPFSIQVVLSLLAAGSKDQTLHQLLAFLKADTAADLNFLYSQLVSSILADGSGGPKLAFANAVWFDKTLSLKPSFKKVVDIVYKASCKEVDFHKAEEVANKVNAWAGEQTNGLIKKIITTEDVKNLNVFMLANAVYFKGSWSQSFNQSWTTNRDFHLLNGSKVKVPFMTSNKDQFVCEYGDFKVLELPYSRGQDNRKFTMYFYLPNAKDGLQSLIKRIGSTSDFFDRYVPCVKVEVREFYLPKFKISFGFEASEMLKKLGLELPFVFGHRSPKWLTRLLTSGFMFQKSTKNLWLR